MELNESPIEINEYTELEKRNAFRASLSFRPKFDRDFGSILLAYRFLEKIPCGIDSCHTPHLSGYLISTSDGLETAIGKDCGSKLFGAEFSKERRRVNEALARRRRLAQINELLQKMPSTILRIDEIESEYQSLQELKQRLHGNVGDNVYAALRERAQRENSIIERQIPMTDEEAEAFFLTSNRSRSDGKGWPTKTIHVATLSGLSFIRARFKDMVIRDLAEPVRRLSLLTIYDVEKFTRHELSKTAKWVGEIPKHIKQAEETIEQGHIFFSKENISKLTHLGASRTTLQSFIADLDH